MTKKIQNQFILLTVSGPDKPGITSSLMEILVKGDSRIIDMGQSVTYGLLSLSILIEVNSNHTVEYPVIKDLLFKSKQLGMDLDFEIIDQLKKTDPTDYRYILNCVAPEDLSAACLFDISKTLSNHTVNIHRIDNVTPNSFQCLEFLTTVEQHTDIDKLRKDLMKISNLHSVDIAYLRDDIFRRSKRLIVFDMDSTLIDAEVIDEMAEVHGVGTEIKSITHRAMNGELDFNQSLIERVSKLKGLEVKKMEEILERLPYMPGVEEFIKTVKSLGLKTALISGGFTFFAHAIKEKLGLDYAFANELEIENGVLTGRVKGTIINADQKALLLKLIAQQENISLDQVVAIGDGANDLPMLNAAGLGIAFHAKEVVKEKANNHMSHGPMTSILYFLGIPVKNS